jgi:2,3-bisphosphoglycerate-dependent phosphoglycerate mutase
MAVRGSLEGPEVLVTRARYASGLVTETADLDPEPASYPQHRFEPPPGALDLLLVRHGQSEAYQDGKPFALVGGHGDPPLSELGQEQARQLATRLRAAGIAAIYVTTLQRTAQTATPLARALGLRPVVEPDLREVNLGDWEGGEFRKMVATAHPVAQRMIAEERWDVIPGAEPTAEFAGRVRAAIERLAAVHPGERVAAFTHGGVIGQAMSLASDSRPFAFIGAENASVSRLVVTGDRWIVRSYNDTAHLDGSG